MIRPILTRQVIDAGAQRLASFGDESVWPESWSPLDVLQMRIHAERVIRAALAEMGVEFDDRTGEYHGGC